MLKKGATPAMDAAPCCFIQDSPTLRDLDGLGDLLLRLGLRHGDGQDTLVVDAHSAILMDVSISMPWQDRPLYSFGTKYILLRSYDYGSLCKPLHSSDIL